MADYISISEDEIPLSVDLINGGKEYVHDSNYLL